LLESIFTQKRAKTKANTFPHIWNENDRPDGKTHKSKKSEVMEATGLSEARIYLGTYAKYNEGSIEGKWFDLSDFSDKDEFYEVCKELHADEENPEYMLQDWKNIPDELIGKS